MFAPKVAKAQTKESTGSTSSSVRRHTTLATRRRHAPAEQVLMLQRTLGNQATQRLLAKRGPIVSREAVGDDHEKGTPGHTTTLEAPRGSLQDFSTIPVFGPDQQADSSSPTQLQRAHVDTNTHRKVFDSPRYQGDAKLEACLNDEDRLEPGATGESVRRIQEGLAQDPNPPATLSPDDITGVYDAKTGQAVMAFKKKYNLGSTNFPDVGPGTTAKLDELANSGKGVEPAPPSPPGPGPAPLSTVDFWINAFIPNSLSGVRPAPGGPFAGRQVFPGPPHPFHRNSCFETDDRSFSPARGASSRVAIDATVDTTTGSITSRPGGVTPTFEIDCDTGALKCLKTPAPSISAARLPSLLSSGSALRFEVTGEGNDPCVFGSPALAFRGIVTIDLATRIISFIGASTFFPAFEMWATAGGAPTSVFTKAPAGGSVFLLLIPGFDPTSGSTVL
jgi:peptidoglycan hydrolase-like protein with peptidoglycan-binding domain